MLYFCVWTKWNSIEWDFSIFCVNLLPVGFVEGGLGDLIATVLNYKEVFYFLILKQLVLSADKFVFPFCMFFINFFHGEAETFILPTLLLAHEQLSRGQVTGSLKSLIMFLPLKNIGLKIQSGLLHVHCYLMAESTSPPNRHWAELSTKKLYN